MQLPKDFIENIKPLLQEEFNLFTDALNNDTPISIRVNDKLDFQPSTKKVAWCKNGYYLAERPLFTADPLHHAGAYYVQEASSMFLGEVLRQLVAPKSIVLDLSAAPGGKSTHISQHLNHQGFLVSNEIIRSRANILMENSIKWGNPNIMVTNNTPSDFGKLGELFDVVVVDAPCSGEGMFRKNHDAINEWSRENVAMCAMRQRDIITDVWDSLKQDGILIYSTCTYNREENEENIQWIENELGASFISIDTEEFSEITATKKGYRFFPHKTKGEGFFIAALRKNSEAPKLKFNKKKSKPSITKLKEQSQYEKMLLQTEKFLFFEKGNSIFALDKTYEDLANILLEKLKILHIGIKLGEKKRDSFIPDISLALSKQINRANFTEHEIDKPTALQYLHRDSIQLPDDTPKGIILLTYQSVPIGWIKNLGNRSNNLYPQEWRIRMDIANFTNE